jgi:hypothetical protein
MNWFGFFLKIILIIIVAGFIWLFVESFSLGGYYVISRTFESETITNCYGSFNTSFKRDQFRNITDEQLANYNRYWSPEDYIQKNSEEEFSIFTNFGITNVTKDNCCTLQSQNATVKL